jgi:DNA-binding Lrp family transcriptional regulator
MTAKRLHCVADCRIFRQNNEKSGETSMKSQKDTELLGLLRLNAREPVASLARKLGVSRTTVQDRLRKLENEGTIAGYSVKLAPDALSGGIGAMVTLGVEPKRQIDVGKAIARLPQVETLYTVSGKYDLIALIKTNSPEAMDKLIDEIGLVSGVTDIETSVILSTKVDRR